MVSSYHDLLGLSGAPVAAQAVLGRARCDNWTCGRLHVAMQHKRACTKMHKGSRSWSDRSVGAARRQS